MSGLAYDVLCVILCEVVRRIMRAVSVMICNWISSYFVVLSEPPECAGTYSYLMFGQQLSSGPCSEPTTVQLFFSRSMLVEHIGKSGSRRRTCGIMDVCGCQGSNPIGTEYDCVFVSAIHLR